MAQQDHFTRVSFPCCNNFPSWLLSRCKDDTRHFVFWFDLDALFVNS